MCRSPIDTTAFTTFLSSFDITGLLMIYLYFPSTSDLVTFLFSTSGFPLHIYLTLLLRLPLVYEARVANGSIGSTTTAQAVPPQSFVAEWRSLMAISTLILSAVLTIFQLPGAFADPLLRLAGFLSFSFSFFGFHYGCLLINQVGSSGTAGAAVTENVIESGGVEFQTTANANRWIRALDRTEVDRNRYWTFLVLLALPAIWTAWSVTAFLFTFIVLLCHASQPTPTSTVTATAAELVPVMLVMVIGTIYFVLAIRALRSW